MLTVGSLFAGIGGFDLGFERAGFEIKWQVEIDPFCRAVLAKHWPQVRRYEDVRTVHGWHVDIHRMTDECSHCLMPVDVLCGGFPCQDISVAGKGEGIDGERSGLWREYDRLIGELRPRYVVVENVSALLVRGLGRVLGDLATRGYDAEWDCIPASAIGQCDRPANRAVDRRTNQKSRKRGEEPVMPIPTPQMRAVVAALKALADKVDDTSDCDHVRHLCSEIGCVGYEVKVAREALAAFRRSVRKRVK